MIFIILLNIVANMGVVFYQAIVGLIIFIKRLRFKIKVRNSVKNTFNRRFSLVNPITRMTTFGAPTKNSIETEGNE